MVSLHAVGLRDLREFELNCSLRFQSKGGWSFVEARAPPSKTLSLTVTIGSQKHQELSNYWLPVIVKALRNNVQLTKAQQ